MSNWLAEFEFLRPFWLLLIPFSIFVVLVLAKQQSRGGWHNTLSAEKLAALTPSSGTGSLHSNTQAEKTRSTLSTSEGSGNPNSAAAMTWFVIPGIVISLLALAGPTWQATQNPLASQRQAMVILFDLSPSMLAQDLKPDRLTRARLKVIDLLRSRTEGETALIVYAGDAHRIAPLSNDAATVEALVHTLHPEIMPIVGSQVESAVTLALELFHGADLEQGDILLVTDGLHPDANRFIIDTLPANFRLSVLGVGSAGGAAIPVKPNGFLVDDSGNTVIARLDETSLQNLTQHFAGHYARLSDDASDVESLTNLASEPYDYRLFSNNLTTSTAQYDSRHDAGYWLVLMLLPLAALAFRRQVLWVMLLCTCIPSMMVPMVLWPSTVEAREWSTDWQWLWLNRDQQGLQALRDGDATTAAQLFNDPLWQATALYEKGDYKAAAELMHRTMKADKSSSVKSKRFITHNDFYNLGNALALSGQYKAALQAYEYSLGLDPHNIDAQHNRTIVLALVPNDEDNADEDANQSGGKTDDTNQQTASEDANANRQDAASNGAYQQSGAALGAGQSLDQSAISGDSVTADQSVEPSKPEPAQTDNLNNTDSNQVLLEDSSTEAAENNNSPRDELIDKRGDESVLNPYSEQWLKNLVDDPGGYLRRKLQYQAQERLKQNNGEPPKLDEDRH